MIKICDRTLSCLDDYSVSANRLIRLAALLFECDADYLEISEKAVRTIGGFPPFGSYVMRIDSLEKVKQYHFADKFICERKSDDMNHVYSEIFVNDFRDSSLIMGHSDEKMIRLTGFDSVFRDSVETCFTNLKNFIPRRNEFSPKNSLGCAVAAAVEWLNAGCGDTIVTSFGGIGGFAPFEQILICLRQLFRRHPQTNYDMLPLIDRLISEITQTPTENCKPITGSGIFTVESGIHINGILTLPKCYEPFSPESVGGTRRFTYGKFSGVSAIKHKLEELGVNTNNLDINAVTKMIKEKSEEENCSFSDEKLLELIKSL